MAIVNSSRVLSVTGKRESAGSIESMGVNINFDDVKFEANQVVVKYTYTIFYEKSVGSISVVGELVITDPNLKKYKDEFDKTKVLSVEIAEDVVTAATFTASASGTLLAYALNLPAPLNIPRAKLQANKFEAKQAS